MNRDRRLGREALAGDEGPVRTAQVHERYPAVLHPDLGVAAGGKRIRNDDLVR